MATDDEELDEMISIRVSKRDMRAMDRLSDLLPIKRITIARIALRVGLDALAKDPLRMIREQGRSKKRAATSKPRRRRA